MSIGSDVILAGEMICWVGRTCTDEDVKLLFGNVSSYSPFINYNSMGFREALLDMFEAILDVHRNESNFDDQLAVTQAYAGIIPVKWRIDVDRRQLILGSFFYSQATQEHCPPYDLGYNLTCWDGSMQKYVVEGCCGYGFHNDTLAMMFGTDPTEAAAGNCDIYRKGNASPAAESFFIQAFHELEPHPLLWHGDGPFHPAVRQALAESRRCSEIFSRGV